MLLCLVFCLFGGLKHKSCYSFPSKAQSLLRLIMQVEGGAGRSPS